MCMCFNYIKQLKELMGPLFGKVSKIIIDDKEKAKLFLVFSSKGPCVQIDQSRINTGNIRKEWQPKVSKKMVRPICCHKQFENMWQILSTVRIPQHDNTLLQLQDLNRERVRQNAQHNISPDIGSMAKICPQVFCILFPGEIANFCWIKGKFRIGNYNLSLTNFSIYIAMMKLLQTSSGKTSDNATDFSKWYSLVSKKIFPMRNGWKLSMIIQGQIHHYIGHLMADPNKQGKCI